MITNQEKSPEFNLRVAKSIVEEASQKIDEIWQIYESERKIAREEGKRFGLAKSIRKELNVIMENLDRAATIIEDIEPSVSLDDGTNCKTVMSMIYFEKGRIYMKVAQIQSEVYNTVWKPGYKSNLEKARDYFEKSYEIFPTQEASYNIALTLYVGLSRNKEEIINAFQRVIEMNPDSEIAVEAGKIIAELRHPPKRRCKH